MTSLFLSRLRALALGAVVAAVVSPAAASSIFLETFDAENGGASQLNYTGFGQFTVDRGTVDIIANGGFALRCAGGAGSCVDLDGSTGAAGRLVSTPFDLVLGLFYDLSFDISGNQRGGASDTLSFGLTGGQLAAESVTLAPFAPFETIVRRFAATASGPFSIFFDHAGRDNVGIILDNVSVASVDIAPVPLPATLPLLLAAFGAVGLVGRRRPRRT